MVKVVEHSFGTSGPQDDIDIYAPGMIIFALFMLSPQTAFLVAHEIRWSTFLRLRLTRLSALENLGGVGLAQMIFATFLVIIVFLAGYCLAFTIKARFC